jgi:hypothetical protein
LIRVTVADLERRLHRVPPALYVDWLSSHPSEEAQSGFDPKTVCVLNLELRQWFVDGWDHSDKFFISGDLCGNYFFIPDAADRVLLLSHDPKGIEDTKMSVRNFLETETWTKSAIDQDADKGVVVIARTEIVGESILDPISLAEWGDALARTSELHSLGGVPSIFTGEVVSSRRRDLAYGTFEGVEIQALFHNGRIEVYGRRTRERRSALSLAQRIARNLGARVMVGSQKPSGRSWLWRSVESHVMSQRKQ